MATAEQMKALVRSHAEGDDDRFYSIAMQVAARAARSGQERFAQDLRDLIDSFRSRPDSRLGRRELLPSSWGELTHLLSVTYPAERLSDLSVDERIRERLLRILVEQRQRERLSQFGFQPVHRVLLVGPPGTGKTLSAHALAGELSWPLFSIRLDGLLTKYLGESAAKLRVVFDAIVDTQGVYLFDEVDALASERATSNDVGEIRRILNSFLQFLEQDTSRSLLIAATNYPQLLDPAIFRRFEMVVQYGLPDAEVTRSLILNRLSSFRVGRLNWNAITEATEHLSHAEIVVAVDAAAKTAILSNDDAVTSSALVSALRERMNGLNPATGTWVRLNGDGGSR